MGIETAVAEVKKKYAGLGWPTCFVKIRFFTAPYAQLEARVPRRGFIVDLGCGYGLFSNLLASLSGEREVLGTELDGSKIKYADRGVPNARFARSDITKAGIPPADCVLLIHVLHHLDSYEAQERLIAECRRNLKAGGRLIVCEVAEHPWWKYVLAVIADHLLYPGQPIFYRFPDRLLPLLRCSFADVAMEPMHRGTPFSHVTYICTK